MSFGPRPEAAIFATNSPFILKMKKLLFTSKIKMCCSSISIRSIYSIKAIESVCNGMTCTCFIALSIGLYFWLFSIFI